MISFPKTKINLGLRVVNRRADGYHNIESLFYPIDIHDVLEMIPSPDGNFLYSGSGLEVPCNPEDNLVVKAYRVMQRLYQLPEVHIHLHKIIPMGSGTGGGSSDGAYVILMANKLFQLGLKYSEMKDISTQIGSDCPFFIDPRPMIVTGRGELLEPVCFSLAQYNILLVFPGINIDTKKAYQGVSPQKPNESITDIVCQPVENWKDLLINDFELNVFQKFPVLAELKQQLYDAGALYASMTGSGSAIYGIFKEDVDEVKFSKQYYTYICKARA